MIHKSYVTLSTQLFKENERLFQTHMSELLKYLLLDKGWEYMIGSMKWNYSSTNRAKVM